MIFRGAPPADLGPAREIREEWRYVRLHKVWERFPDWPDQDSCRRCVYCGGPLTGRQLRWCGTWCVLYAQIRCGQSGAMRRLCEIRDQGQCQICRAHTGAWQAAYRDALRAIQIRESDLMGRHQGYSQAQRRIQRRIGRAAQADLARIQRRRRALRLPRGHLWEADRVIPVVEGGGFCGPDGIRTLCLPCHKAETARLAARLAGARRSQLDLGLEDK